MRDISKLRHALHTPLNHILGYTEIMMEDAGEQRGLLPHLQRIQANARQVVERIRACFASGEAADLERLQREVRDAVREIHSEIDALRGCDSAQLESDLARVEAASSDLLAIADRDLGAERVEPGPLPFSPPRQTEGRILVVDDNEINRDIVCRQLERQGFTAIAAPDGRSALEVLRRDTAIDLLLLDIVMPGLDGFQVLSALKADPILKGLPVIMLSALDEADSVTRCLEAGADDFVPKPSDQVLLRARIGTILLRKLAEREREEMAESFRLLLESTAEGIFGLDISGRCTFMNDAAAKALGYDRNALLGIQVHDTIHHSRQDGSPYPVSDCPMIKTAREGKRARVDDELLFRKDGSSFPVEYSSNPVVRDGEVRGAVVTFQDISDRRRSEEQLRQTAKLESLGILAGGIAHDFNNLLTGILGNASLMFESAGVRDPNRELLQEILDATERAAKLTSQMLAYAGKGQFVIEPLNLATSVKEMAGLIASSVPKNVLVRYQLEERIPAIEADALQMHQIIMNLVINAGEAIGAQNGVVIVRTGAVDRSDMPAAALMPADLPQGRYVFLEVSDTGSGIAPEVISRIFDPFFSTKFTGRGLGLPAALGIVRAHNGAIQLESEPGKGSRFIVYFPAVASVPANEIRQAQSLTRGGYETILVIDDEDVVRRTAANALAQFGYRVLLAEDGPEGIEQLRRHADSVALIVLDLTMPKMSGEEAARFLHASAPGAPIIISSGYDEGEVRRHLTSHAIAGYIRKPYRADQLAAKIRSVLDSRGSRGSSA